VKHDGGADAVDHLHRVNARLVIVELPVPRESVECSDYVARHGRAGACHAGARDS
jgi:hypothetical protein